MPVQPLWSFWRGYAAAIADRQVTIWLTVVYFVVIGPTWLVARLAGRAFFVQRSDPAGYWRDRPPPPRALADLRRPG